MRRPWQTGTLRNLPLWAVITSVNTSVLLGFLLWKRATQNDLAGSPAPLLAIFWLGIGLYLLFGKPAARADRLDLALPIPPRDLWRRHLIGTLLGATTVLAASLAVLEFHVWLLSRIGPGATFEVPIWSLAGQLLAGSVLATAWVDAIEPGLRKPRSSAHYWPRALARVVAVLLLLVLLCPWPIAAIAVCAALAVAMILRGRRQVPGAYRLVPLRSPKTAGSRTDSALASRSDTASAGIANARTVGRWQVFRLVYSVLHTAPPWKQFSPWLLYFFVALMGFVLAGGLNRWIDASDLRFLYLPFGSYMLLAGFGLLTYHLFRLDPLPIRRRTIFAVLTVPGMLIFCASYAVGLLALATDPDPATLLDYHVVLRADKTRSDGADREPTGPDTRVWVEVDPAFMGVTLTGEVPELTSPWGEAHPAWSEPLFRGLPIRIFSPYNTPDDTTADFEALLTSRAIETVYGETIAPEAVRERYFEVESDRVTGIRGETVHTAARGPLSATARSGLRFGEQLLVDHPGLESPPKGPETPVYLVLALAPWLLLTALIVRSFRATHSTRYIRWMYWAALALLMGSMLLQVLLGVLGLFSPDAARTILAVAIQRLGTTPLLWLSTWVVGIAVIGLAYRIALGQFEHAEIPASPLNCSWIDWGTEA